MSIKEHSNLHTIFNLYASKYKHSKKRYKVGIPIFLILLIFYVFCLPSTLFQVPYSTVVTDKDGELLGARIANDQQWRFPKNDSLPEKYTTCVLQFEDKHFKHHWGVNPVSIARALKQNIISKRVVSGASTITMQTIRLSRKESRTYFEKIIEIVLATRLEFSYSKDEILELYAAHAPMGGNVVGIEAASWRYFGHSSHNLSWGEAATLAILPNSPSMMHFGRNREKLTTKRNKLLESLLRDKKLSKMDYELAILEPLPPHPLALPKIAPHLVTRIHSEKNGQEVKTTLSKYQQEQVEMVLERWNAEFAQNGIHNMAALVLNVETNEVVAYCGNVNFERHLSGNQVDVIQSPRSTGSILKPFLYCAMLQEGLLLPDELLPDVPININGFAPKNFSLKYDGASHASEALSRSLNVPFVVSLRSYTIPKFYNLLKRGGLRHLTHTTDHYGLSLILGGAEASLWDISCMYLQMAQSVTQYSEENRSRPFTPPHYIKSEKLDESEKKQTQPIFNAGAAYQTLEALTNVNRPEELDWRSVPSVQKIAWKTGTSFGFRDALSVGVTAKYVVGVWVGNSDGEGRPGLIGARTAGMVMFDIFNTLSHSRWFNVPENDLYETEICKESGMLRSVNCPEESIVTRYITDKGRDGNICKYHKLVHLSEDLQYQVYEDCAGDRGIVTKSWFVLPPIWEWYYKEKNISYKSLPPYSPECKEDGKNKLMEFIYPFPNLILSTPKQLDGTLAKVVFELAHRSQSNTVYWHLDNKYIGETTDIHKKEYTPEKGEHTLIVVDESGEMASVHFSVR